MIDVARADLILSPAYYIGAMEDELRRHWGQHYSY